MATPRLSFTFFCPINSRKNRGRSLSSKEASSSANAAETRRSLFKAFCCGAATRAIVKRNGKKGQSSNRALVPVGGTGFVRIGNRDGGSVCHKSQGHRAQKGSCTAAQLPQRTFEPKAPCAV